MNDDRQTLDAKQREEIVAIIGEENLAMLALYAIEGMSCRSIGGHFGLSKSTVHARMGKATETLAAHGLWPIAGGRIRHGRGRGSARRVAFPEG